MIFYIKKIVRVWFILQKNIANFVRTLLKRKHKQLGSKQISKTERIRHLIYTSAIWKQTELNHDDQNRGVKKRWSENKTQYLGPSRSQRGRKIFSCRLNKQFSLFFVT